MSIAAMPAMIPMNDHGRVHHTQPGEFKRIKREFLQVFMIFVLRQSD